MDFDVNVDGNDKLVYDFVEDHFDSIWRWSIQAILFLNFLKLVCLIRVSKRWSG